MSAQTVITGAIQSASADSALSTEFGSEITQGLADIEALTNKEKVMRFSYVSDGDIENESQVGNTVTVQYDLLVSIGFTESNKSTAETRKSNYSKMLRDWIDDNRDLNGTCDGRTKLGRLLFMEIPDYEGYYFGVAPLMCYREETRGNR